MLLAVTMLPASGLQSAYADEPAARPATTGGDAALEGYASEGAPVANQRADGTLVVDGLVYAIVDGGLALVGFDGLPQGEDAVKEVTVPASVLVDGNDTPVVAVSIAEGNVAENVVALTLPQSIEDVDTATLATALPNLASVEIATPKASAPVAAGAAAMRAAYSSFGGVLYKNAWVATDGDASQTTLAKELVWAPPATVVARIPVECTSIVAGAFTDVKDLKTVVCFGVMGEIPQAKKADDGTVVPGAFTDDQIQTVNVIVPQTGTVVSDSDRISADVAVTDGSTMDIKREAWWRAGFASDRITLGEVCGSTTNTLPVTEEGVLETAEAEVAYAPETTQNSSSRKAGIEPPESAIPTPVPDDDSIDPSESGLVFTHLADMTLSVSWKGDPTATPKRIEIPAYVTIDGVAYPVTDIAEGAFKGAVFLEDVVIPDTVTAVGDSAFEGCANLSVGNPSSDFKDGGSTAFYDHDAEAESFDTDSVLFDRDDLSDFVTPYFTSDGSIDINVNPAIAYQLTVQNQSNTGHMILSNKTLAINCTVGGAIYWGMSGFYTNMLHLYPTNADGSDLGSATIIAPAGWVFTGTTRRLFDVAPSDGSYREHATIYLAREKVMSINDDLLNTASFAGTGSALTAARSDHNHNSSYAALGDFNSLKTTVTSKADSSTVTNLTNTVNTKANATDLNAVKATADQNKTDVAAINNSFASISYSGLDGSDTSVFPTSYRKGGTPALPAPKKAGSEFRGWTWSGQSEPTTDAAVIKGAFAAGGDVTLTANWGVPSASYFFATDDPFNVSGADTQTYTIAVKLSDSAGTVRSLAFENDNDVLVPSGADIAFAVGNSLDASGALASPLMTATGFGAATGSAFELASLGSQSWGVYVRVSVPKAAVDADAVTKSFVDGSYVAKFVKLNYELS